MSEFTQSANVVPSPSLSLQLPPLPATERGVGSWLATCPSDPDLLIYTAGKYVGPEERARGERTPGARSPGLSFRQVSLAPPPP